VGPDGSLYITDDAAGRIWRVMYQGRERWRVLGKPLVQKLGIRDGWAIAFSTLPRAMSDAPNYR